MRPQVSAGSEGPEAGDRQPSWRFYGAFWGVANVENKCRHCALNSQEKKHT